MANVGSSIVKFASLMLLLVVTGVVLVGCSGGVSEADKAKTAERFKTMNKNDVNNDATR